MTSKERCFVKKITIFKTKRATKVTSQKNQRILIKKVNLINKTGDNDNYDIAINV